MPCNSCGCLLCIGDRKGLFCPRCDGETVETKYAIEAKTEWFLEEYFSGENLIELLKNYDKKSLITALLTRLNHIAYQFKEENGLPVDRFRYLPYFIKLIYKTDGYGDEFVKTATGLNEELNQLFEGYKEVIEPIRKARDGLNVAIRRNPRGPWTNLPSEYVYHSSELNLCVDRCIGSLLCGDFGQYPDYSFVVDNIRAVDKTDVRNIDTPWEFGDAWYQLIIQMLALAAIDEFAGEVFYTEFPEDVTILEIEDFLNNLDSCLTPGHQIFAIESTGVPELSKEQVEASGYLAFGEKWEKVREYVIVSEEHPKAHPFLFEIESNDQYFIDVLEQSVELETRKYIYPNYLSFLLKFQAFPLVKNGSVDDKGHDLLTDLTAKRGKAAEKNLFEILSKRGIETYHSAKLPLKDDHEIDLIYRKGDSLTFIEMKYFRPPIRLQSGEGIRIMRENFDEKIFKIESENTSKTPSGKPFPEKVEKWMSRPVGSEFSSKSASGDKEIHSLDRDWFEADVNMFVVSNLVPPYITKNGVRFLTDVEFFKLIAHESDDVLIQPPDRSSLV